MQTHQGTSGGFSLRIGILGAARVLRKSWPAIYRAGHTVAFLGCRDPVKGKALADTIISSMNSSSNMAMPLIGSYDDAVRASCVDVVYITLPVALRDHWVRACIEQGKHVVGEKPAAASAAQLMNWLEAMSPRRLLYMDGTMFTHSKRLVEVKHALHALGRLHHIDVQMCFRGSDTFLREDIRCHTALEPHGALGDLGWYAICWILHLVNFALPEKVSGRITSCAKDGGAITGFDGQLLFLIDEEPVTAALFCSFEHCYEQTVKILASGGVIDVHGAVNPTGETRPSFSVEQRTWGLSKEGPRQMTCDTNIVECEDDVDQATALWRSVGTSLERLGKGEPLLVNAEKGCVWSRYAYITQLVMDQMLQCAMQVGLSEAMPSPKATSTATPVSIRGEGSVPRG